MLCGSVSSSAPSAPRTQRLRHRPAARSLASPPASGSMPRRAEEITQPLGNVRSPEEPCHRFAGNGGECRFSRRAHLGVAVFGQQREQPDLLERARRQRAAGREQANILGDFSTLEEIQHWAAETEIHQGVRKFLHVGERDTRADDVPRSAERPCRRARSAYRRTRRRRRRSARSVPSALTTRLSPAFIRPENTCSPSALTDTQHRALGRDLH